jgi:hypothetical protein
MVLKKLIVLQPCSNYQRMRMESTSNINLQYNVQRAMHDDAFILIICAQVQMAGKSQYQFEVQLRIAQWKNSSTPFDLLMHRQPQIGSALGTSSKSLLP